MVTQDESTHIMLIVGVSRGPVSAGLIPSLPHGTLPNVRPHNVMVATTAALNAASREVNQVRQVNPLGNEK